MAEDGLVHVVVGARTDREPSPAVDVAVSAAVDAVDGIELHRSPWGFAVAVDDADRAWAVAEGLHHGLAAAASGVAPALAVHSGPVEDETPPAARVLGEAARLCDHVAVGAVVCSGATAHLLGADVAPARIGRVALDQLDGWMAVHAADGSSLRSAPRPLGYRPHEPGLVGRVSELAHLEALATEHRLLTIKGASGTGKSTLLRELARRLAADPAYVVDLVGITDSVACARRLATALGVDWWSVADHDASGAVAAAVRHVGDRGALLFVDQSRTAPGAAEAIGELLSRCTGLRVVATARESLGLADERVWPIPAYAEAHELLVTRAVEQGLSVEPDGATEHALGALAAALGGVPFACELVAPQLATRGVDTALADVETRRPAAVPTRRARDDADAVATAVRVTVDALSRPARTLLARLGLMPSSFSPAAMEAFAVVEPTVPDGVAEILAVPGLLLREVGRHGPRLRLPEPVQDWARRELQELGDAGDLMAALVDHLIEGAPTDAADGLWSREPLAELVPELSTVSTTLAWLGEQRDAHRYELLSTAYAGAAARFGDADRFGEALRWPISAVDAPVDLRARTFMALSVCGLAGTRSEHLREGTLGLMFLGLEDGDDAHVHAEAQSARDEMAEAFRAGTVDETALERLQKLAGQLDQLGHSDGGSSRGRAVVNVHLGWHHLLMGEWAEAASVAATATSGSVDGTDWHRLAVATEAMGRFHTGAVGDAWRLVAALDDPDAYDFWGHPIGLVAALATSAAGDERAAASRTERIASSGPDHRLRRSPVRRGRRGQLAGRRSGPDGSSRRVVEGRRVADDADHPAPVAGAGGPVRS